MLEFEATLQYCISNTVCGQIMEDLQTRPHYTLVSFAKKEVSYATAHIQPADHKGASACADVGMRLGSLPAAR
jgi:hypothetical protein